jgi:(2Fe-2S) ferredoxin
MSKWYKNLTKPDVQSLIAKNKGNDNTFSFYERGTSENLEKIISKHIKASFTMFITYILLQIV